LQTAVERAVAASGASAAIVGVRVPWAGVWDAGIGTVAPGGAAVSDAMTFHAGAVTRSMTCDVLYGLVHDGVVSLDDPVGKYVTGLGDQGARDGLTLGQLCDSTSGIGPYDPSIDARIRATPSRVWTPRELMAFGMSRESTAQPGTVFADSDTGYVLLGFALERATGKTASQLYQQYVFGPNGMTSTSLPDNGTAELDGLWTGTAADGSAACTAPPRWSACRRVPASRHPVSSAISPTRVDTCRLAMGSSPTPGRFENPLRGGERSVVVHRAWLGVSSLIGQYGSVPGALTAAFADRTTGMSVVVTLNNSRASATSSAVSWELAAIASKAPAASGRTARRRGCRGRRRTWPRRSPPPRCARSREIEHGVSCR
jgi:D-alanyl-D-alanine carboxypeptidase